MQLWLQPTKLPGQAHHQEQQRPLPPPQLLLMATQACCRPRCPQHSSKWAPPASPYSSSGSNTCSMRPPRSDDCKGDCPRSLLEMCWDERAGCCKERATCARVVGWTHANEGLLQLGGASLGGFAHRASVEHVLLVDVLPVAC